MAKFRKKNVVISAEQFVLPEGVKVGDMFMEYQIFGDDKTPLFLLIETREGVMRAELGDWIITGVKGERYPCKPEIFDMTYSPVSEVPNIDVDRQGNEVWAGTGQILTVQEKQLYDTLTAIRDLLDRILDAVTPEETAPIESQPTHLPKGDSPDASQN